MLLEGELNLTLILIIIAAVTTVAAVIAVYFAVTNRVQHVSTSDELDLVQKIAEAADKRLFQTLNAIPVALVETDRQGKFVFANRAAHQLLGRRDAELLGLRFHSATWGITFPDGRPVPPDLLPSARALRGQTVKGFQHMLANPATRRKMLVSVTAMPIEDDHGTVIGSTAAIVESEGLVTPEAAGFDAAFADAPSNADDRPEDPTRRVFQAASSALVVVGIDGMVREANQTALAVLGRSDDVMGADFADLFLSEDARVEGRQSLRAALTAPAGEADPIVVHRLGMDPIIWRLLPLAGEDGHADAVLLAGERLAAEPVATPTEPVVATAPTDPDIQERLEQALTDAATARQDADQARAALSETRERARAERDASQRLESVGRLTGGVAQDFNALLQVMTSALDMVLKQADDPSRVRRLSQAALAAGQRGEALTRRLSAFSEGDDASGSQVLDAGVLLRGLEGRLRALTGDGIDLMVEAPSTPALARIDPVAFDGAVTALVRNAIEALDGAGSIAVRLEALDDQSLRLSVRDTGSGMDPDVASRAVEPFFTTRPGAAGLGLTQAHAFARQSAGALEIQSDLGAGAAILIILPQAV